VSAARHDHDLAPAEPGLTAARAQARLEVLTAKGVLNRVDVRRGIDWLVSRSPADGARLVARAWRDDGFRRRLLADATIAAREVGLDSGPSPLVALENTARIHHMVVCTLCSCYPRALLGPPPDWYKSLGYRSRAVRDPRGVLAEFGLTLPEGMEVRVMDSTAAMRYLVIPRRPPESAALSEDELSELVTRDAMIGVAEARRPGSAQAPRGAS
jgi:nitrile hydratase subunit alpha